MPILNITFINEPQIVHSVACKIKKEFLPNIQPAQGLISCRLLRLIEAGGAPVGTQEPQNITLQMEFESMNRLREAECNIMRNFIESHVETFGEQSLVFTSILSDEQR